MKEETFYLEDGKHVGDTVCVCEGAERECNSSIAAQVVEVMYCRRGWEGLVSKEEVAAPLRASTNNAVCFDTE